MPLCKVQGYLIVCVNAHVSAILILDTPLQIPSINIDIEICCVDVCNVILYGCVCCISVQPYEKSVIFHSGVVENRGRITISSVSGHSVIHSVTSWNSHACHINPAETNLLGPIPCAVIQIQTPSAKDATQRELYEKMSKEMPFDPRKEWVG